jgi:hypothetical protein
MIENLNKLTDEAWFLMFLHGNLCIIHVLMVQECKNYNINS